MKILTFFMLFITTVSLDAKEYYAKVEPYELNIISSNVAGEVMFVDEERLGEKLTSKPFIVIDAAIDKQDLNATKEKIAAIEAMYKADEEIIKNLQESLARKKQNYERIKDLSIKSKTQKDTIYFDLIATKNQLLATKKEQSNFSSQLSDLHVKQARLKKLLQDKTVTAKGYVLYELLVKKSQVVAPSTPLAKVANISKAVLSVYVDKNELENIKNKVLYIDSKPTPYTSIRVNYIADSVNISTYKVQVVLPAPAIFSQLVKVEFK